MKKTEEKRNSHLVLIVWVVVAFFNAPVEDINSSIAEVPAKPKPGPFDGDVVH